LVIAAPKFEGNHGSKLLEIAIKGHCYLQPNPKSRRERMGRSGKLTPGPVVACCRPAESACDWGAVVAMA
jgi:hypothetical protein